MESEQRPKSNRVAGAPAACFQMDGAELLFRLAVLVGCAVLPVKPDHIRHDLAHLVVVGIPARFLPCSLAGLFQPPLGGVSTGIRRRVQLRFLFSCLRPLGFDAHQREDAFTVFSSLRTGEQHATKLAILCDE